MTSMTSPGETALYALYKIGDKVKDSCVSRQIIKDEVNEDGVVWYR